LTVCVNILRRLFAELEHAAPVLSEITRGEDNIHKRRRNNVPPYKTYKKLDYMCPFCNNWMDRSDAIEAGGWRRVPVHPFCKQLIEETNRIDITAFQEMMDECNRLRIDCGADLGGPVCPGKTLNILVPRNAPDDTDYVSFDKFGYVPLNQYDSMGRRRLRFTSLGNYRDEPDRLYMEDDQEAENDFNEARLAEWNQELDDAINFSRDQTILRYGG